MRSLIGLPPRCLFIVRSRAKVNRLEESYVSSAAQRPLGRGDQYVATGSKRPKTDSKHSHLSNSA